MVSSVRSVYSGLLTYDMTHDALIVTDFYGPGSNHLWEDLGLDIIGISAYFILADTIPTTILSLEELEASWEKEFTDYLVPLRERNPDLPIVFLEFGYVDAIQAPYQPNYGAFEPWVFEDRNANGLDDGQEAQANVYASFFNVNEQHSRLVTGAFLWDHFWGSDVDWFYGFGHLRQMPVRDKLAEDVLRDYYASQLD